VNKKVALSVVSTAVVASLATSAFAAPSAGLYIGGNVDKYYSIPDFVNNEAAARDQINSVGLDNVLFVDTNAKAATALEIALADSLNDALNAVTVEDFAGNVYTNATTGGTYDPSTDEDITDVPAGDLEVESVSAINAKELVVEFNQAVKKSSVIASASAGAEVAGTLLDGVVKVDSAAGDSLVASLSEDGKKLTIVAASDWEGAHSIEFVADLVETADGSATLPAFVNAFTFEDDTRASITGVDFVSKYVYKVKFSEPVSAVGTESAKLADGSAVTLTTADPAYGLATDGKSFTLVFGPATPVNEEITVDFPALTDFAGNVSVPLTAKTTISGADTTKPAISTVTATSATTVKVKFAEPITLLDPTAVSFNGAALTALTVLANADDNTVLDITVPSTTTSGVLAFAAGAVEDLNGNDNAAASKTVNFGSDTVGPVVAKSEVFKDAGLNKLRLTYGEEVTKVGTTLTLKYTDEYGVAKSITIPTAKVNVDTDDNKVVVIDLHDGANPVPEDVTYSLEIPEGYFTDAFANDSALKSITFANNADATSSKLKLIASNPIVTTDATGGSDDRTTLGAAFVDVQFVDAVNAATATNKANYSVENAEVEKAELVYNDPTTANGNGAKAVVRVYIKDNTVEATGNYNVTVSGVKGYNTSVTEMATATKNVAIDENVRPAVTAASFKSFGASSVVTLTFSEAIAADTVADGDFDLYVDGVKVSTATVTNGVLGASIDFTIDTDLSDEVAAGKVVKLVATSALDLFDAQDNKANVTEVTVQ